MLRSYRRHGAHVMVRPLRTPCVMPRMFESSRPLRLTLYTLLIIAGAVLAATLAMRHAERQALVEDAARANQQLALYATSLHTLIERYRALPAVLALDPELRSALKGPVSPEQQDALNRKLEKINGAAAVLDPGTARSHRPGRGGEQLALAQQLRRPQLRFPSLLQPDPHPRHRALLCGGGDQRHSRLLPVQCGHR